MKYFLAIFILVFAIGVFVPKFVNFGNKDWSNPKAFLVASHDTCKKLQLRRPYINCMVEKTKPFVKSGGVRALVDAGEEINSKREVDLVGDINCHDMMHALGKAAGLYAKSIGEAITDCKPICGGGCYHGVLEGKYSQGSDLKQFVSEACLFTRDIKKSEAHCYHGLGHAIAVQTGKINEAFDYCNYVQEEGRIGCGSGAFMELYSSDGFDLNKIPENVPEWCKTFQSVYAEICWLSAGYFRVGNGYLKSLGVDTAKAENEAIYNCSQAPNETLKQGCVYTFGDNIFNILNENSESIYAVCMKFRSELAVSCLRGAAHSAKRNDPSGTKSEELCTKSSDVTTVDECRKEYRSNNTSVL